MRWGNLKLLLFVIVGGLVAHKAAAQQISPMQTKISKVRIEGLRRVDPEAALASTKLSAGKNFDPILATEDLHRVWDTGFFKDVRLEQDSQADGIELIYVVIEKPSVRKVVLSGLDALSEDDVKAVMNVKPYTILDTGLLARNVDKIKDLYVGKGYYLAEVQYDVRPVDKKQSEVDVTFKIIEHDKVTVRQITFIGNKEIDSETIKNSMQTREGNELSWLNQFGTYKEEYFQTDILRIQALYYDHGFVTVKIGEPVATISKDRRYIYLSIQIEEGQKYEVGNISFSGDLQLEASATQKAVDKTFLQEKIRVQKGETFSRTRLFEDIQTLTDIYKDAGYAYANVVPNTQIDPDTKKMHLDLEVEKGEVVYIDRIEVAGNMRTRDKVIRRELRIYEGEKYSAARINLSRARVYQLGYFESVNLVTTKGSDPNTMNIVVEIKEKSTGTFQIGAGFSSVENFIATAQISQNNFLGNGQSLSLSMQLSFGDYARQLVTLQFYEPYFYDTDLSFGLNGYITQRYYRDFMRNSKGLAPNFGYPITHELRLSAGYTIEGVDIVTPQNMEGHTVLFDLSRSGRVSSLNASLTYDSRDNRLFPTKGMFHEARLEFSSPHLGASQTMSFRRTDLTMRLYQPIGFGLVFRTNLQLGLITSGSSSNVPISERYFPGGIYSVRGFQPRGLGPTLRAITDQNDPQATTRDFIYGGNKQVILNLEIEFPIVRQANVRGVIFADAGNAYNDDEGFFYLQTPDIQKSPAYLMGSNRKISAPLGLFYSFGFGVRWLSPIGPLRFEWGIPITKHAVTDRDTVFEFTIGNFF